MNQLLYRLRSAVSRFMLGRNGADTLTWAIAVLAVVLNLLGMLVRHPAVSGVVRLLNIPLLLLMVWRVFSRNTAKRRAENQRFLAWYAPKAASLRNARARHGDRSHKYVRCRCGAYCRVPRGVGKIELTCPKCGARRVTKT